MFIEKAIRMNIEDQGSINFVWIFMKGKGKGKEESPRQNPIVTNQNTNFILFLLFKGLSFSKDLPEKLNLHIITG